MYERPFQSFRPTFINNLGNKIISMFHGIVICVRYWHFTKVTIIQDNNQSNLFITNLMYWLIKFLDAVCTQLVYVSKKTISVDEIM